ncbi:SsgA family sporulation/cell division regulator [Frankia nepalensis]|uniref:SsgA family sporulation/cell division regulator n=2 Tax=Frankia nepalensis TaxID=1836974 RepID=A0A937RJ50_9ACTN|nr:SsgA family sporulation/cell division regulator [Frankia nepalensis]MBL7513733.1 SsgA family sporulation/cell division regulator [Frankia nepalensis]MBL7628299.1 SsgA family sporulation/cell division regulator [Frankia nepalensis]
MSCDLLLSLVTDNGERLPLTGHLSFDPADPMAITLVIREAGGKMVRWTFARDVLAVGGPRPAGVGDVRVQPARGDQRAMALTLTSTDGEANLELPSRRVATFLRQTYIAVPREMEAQLIDWVAEFGPMLGRGDDRTGGSTDI